MRLFCIALLVVIMGGLTISIDAQGPPTGTQRSVTLNWEEPAPVGGSGTIKGYNVYRTPSGAPAYAKLNATLLTNRTHVDTTVASGTQYGYCATTVDSQDKESACSIPVSVTTPSNPNPPRGLAASGQ